MVRRNISFLFSGAVALSVAVLAALPLYAQSPSILFEDGKEHISNAYAAQEYVRVSARDLPPRFVENEIIVKFRGSDRFERVPLSLFDDVETALLRFRARTDVEYAEPNYIARAFFIPNDTYYSYQWHLDSGGSGGIGMESAWDLADGSGVTVAVVDTGVAYEDYRKGRTLYYQAPDLAATSFAPGYDFVENDTHPNDDNGHGTHVAGTIAQSTNNSLGVAGVAFGAVIMPVKVLDSRGSGTYADVADGIRFAVDNGAMVINLSLGGSEASTYLEEAVRYAYEKNVVVVAAAGNDGTGIVSYPAAYDDYVIAVGATRFDESRASYSNYGSSLDIVAPGGDLSVDQNGDGYGDGVLQQTFGTRLTDWGYYFYQGTSMAAPHVAGTAALLLSSGKVTAVEGVRAALFGSAKDLGPAGLDSEYGWGLLDAFAALTYADSSTTTSPIPPTAVAGADITALVGEEIIFDGSGSSDPDGTIVSHTWDFGDGTSASGVTASHSYASAGDYIVTLSVTDDSGLTGSDTLIVNVSELPPPPPALTLHVGDITFTYDKRDRRTFSFCRVTVHVPVYSESGDAVSDALVNGSWSGAYSGSVSGTTASSGEAAFTTSWVLGCGTFVFGVDDVSKEGWLYDSTQNIETTDSIDL